MSTAPATSTLSTISPASIETEFYKDTCLTPVEYETVCRLYPHLKEFNPDSNESLLGPVIQSVFHDDNINVFERQVKNGLNIDCSLEGPLYNLVHAAILCNATKILTFLVEQGAELNGGYVGEHKKIETALFRATQSGQLDLIDLLIQGGAQVNAPGSLCPFRAACAHRNTLQHLLLNTEGPTLSFFDKISIDKSLTYLLLSKNSVLTFQRLFDGFMKRPLAEAAQLFQIVYNDCQTIISLNAPGHAFINIRKQGAAEALTEFKSLFDMVREKYALEKQIENSTQSNKTNSIHKI